jgi:hypothetical protein
MKGEEVGSTASVALLSEKRIYEAEREVQMKRRARESRDTGG